MNLDLTALVLSILSMLISMGVVFIGWYKGRRNIRITFSYNDTDGAMEIMSTIGEFVTKRISLVFSVLVVNKSTNPIAINYVTIGSKEDEILSSLDIEYVTTSRSSVWPPAEGCSYYHEIHLTTTKLPDYVEPLGASLVRLHFYVPIDFVPIKVVVSTSRGSIFASHLTLPISEYINNRGKYTN